MTQKYVFEAKYQLEALKIGHNTSSGTQQVCLGLRVSLGFV